MRCLLKKWARQRVGHKRSVRHCVNVLHQVMKEVTIGSRQKKTGDRKREKCVSCTPMVTKAGLEPLTNMLQQTYCTNDLIQFDKLSTKLTIVIFLQCDFTSTVSK